MWRRVLVAIGIGVIITSSLTLLAQQADYSQFDAQATMPRLALIGGVGFTVFAALLVLMAALDERRALRRAEQMTTALQEREYDLLQSNRELERFATVAAHDLQEPLRTILAFTSLIEKRHSATMEGEALDYLLRVQGAGQRMRALIEDLLIYARIGQAERQFEVVDLNEIVALATANVETLALETNAQITAGDLPTVRGNPPGLTQLFTNLLSNALKYRLESPRVTISAQRRSEEWVISVSDNGRGIDPQNHEKIFELFRRIEAGSGASGTGLGLAICSRVVDAHGGRIWVKSTVGQGATFLFTLPLRSERKRFRKDHREGGRGRRGKRAKELA